jgi:hypothetical protein
MQSSVVRPSAARRGGGLSIRPDPCDDDLPPWVKVGCQPLLVVPYATAQSDSRYLASSGFASPCDQRELLTLGVDELVREGRPALMTVAVHARWTGQAARTAALRGFLEHAAGLEGATFMRRDDIARWWVQHGPPPG